MFLFWILLELRIMKVVVTTGAIQQIVATNKPKPASYRPDGLPIAQPTVSEHFVIIRLLRTAVQRTG